MNCRLSWSSGFWRSAPPHVDVVPPPILDANRWRSRPVGTVILWFRNSQRNTLPCRGLLIGSPAMWLPEASRRCLQYDKVCLLGCSVPGIDGVLSPSGRNEVGPFRVFLFATGTPDHDLSAGLLVAVSSMAVRFSADQRALQIRGRITLTAIINQAADVRTRLVV